jgi:hypothetical protein
VLPLPDNIKKNFGQGIFTPLALRLCIGPVLCNQLLKAGSQQAENGNIGQGAFLYVDDPDLDSPPVKTGYGPPGNSGSTGP